MLPLLTLSGGLSLLTHNCASLPFAKHGHTGEDVVFKSLASVAAHN